MTCMRPHIKDRSEWDIGNKKVKVLKGYTPKPAPPSQHPRPRSLLEKRLSKMTTTEARVYRDLMQWINAKENRMQLLIKNTILSEQYLTNITFGIIRLDQRAKSEIYRAMKVVELSEMTNKYL